MIDPQKWLVDKFPKEIDLEELQLETARNIVRLVGSDEYGGAVFCEARRSESDQEAIVLEVLVSLGQRSTENDIRSKEMIIVECPSDALPVVRSLRNDLPDVPHLNVADSLTPKSLCLYEQAEAEVMLSWTALGFIERIRWWFAKTAYGELHGDAQPLDPILFTGVAFTLIVTGDVLSEEQPDKLFLKVLDPGETGVDVLHLGIRPKTEFDNPVDIAAIIAVSPPQVHGRLRHAPGNLTELKAFDEEFKAGIFATLDKNILHWCSERPEQMNKQLILLLAIPIERHEGRGDEATSLRAFWSMATVGDIGQALGLLDQDPEGGGWSRLIPRSTDVDLDRIKICMGDVRPEFSVQMANTASGTKPKETSVVQIGVGSLGAQVSLTLAQQGYGRWTFVDHDRLLPHNLARHPLSYVFIGRPKSNSLAIYVNNLLGTGDFARSIVCNVLSPGHNSEELNDAISNAGMILDTSASIPVARHLAIDAGTKVPIMSAFFNPTATDLVVIWEGASRSVRLDDCEMAYYTALVTNAALAGHLSMPTDMVVHGTACREPSARIPQSRIIRLAGMAVDTLRKHEDQKAPLICIWRDQVKGLVKTLEVSPPPFNSTMIRDWEVRYSQTVIEGLQRERVDAGEIETGGVLIGSWDRRRKIVYVTGFTGPPPDSKRDATGFIRGVRGLRTAMQKVSLNTLDNLGYVGEWHSHPKHHPANLSADDRAFLREMKEHTLLEDAPALMLVAGEDGVRCAVMRHAAAEKESALLI